MYQTLCLTESLVFRNRLLFIYSTVSSNFKRTKVHKETFITFTELIEVVESNPTDNNYKSAADNLLEAFTDWPTENLEVSEMISELKKEVQDKLTFDNISRFLKTLNPNKDSWKMESLSSILELFDFEQNKSVNKEIELENILEKLTEHYRNKSNC